MSTMTRSRSAAGSIVTLNSCGPRSPITARWTWVFSSANGSRVPWLSVGRVVVRRSWSSISSSSRRGVGAREAPSLPLVPDELLRHAACREERCELAERCRGLRRGLRDRDRHAFVDGARDLAVARDQDVGLAAEDVRDVALADADLASGRG